ncbi:MAG: class I SAM-dependent methyltransferase [Gemmatimonadota bacterium]
MGSPEPETAESFFSASAEAYVRDRFAPEDDALRRIRQVMEAEGLPTIQLPAVTARAVQLLLRIAEARRVVEVGTLAGYSALWIARALPDESDGEAGLVTIEVDPARAALARRLLAEAGVGGRVEVREGPADIVLRSLGPDGSFDAILLDADKEGLPSYVVEARRLLRPGGLLLVDNALWRGQVLDPAVTDPATEAIRRSHENLRSDPAFDATLLPVGDGLLVALRR